MYVCMYAHVYLNINKHIDSNKLGIYTVNIYSVDFIITVLLFMDYFLLQFLSEDLHLDKTNKPSYRLGADGPPGSTDKERRRFLC